MNSFRQTGAILLLSVLIIKAMIAPSIFVNYELRKDFIISNFCVNKDRPELHCDGQCYLAKQLKAAEQQDENEATASFMDKLFGTEFLSESPEFLTDNKLEVLSLGGLSFSYIEFMPEAHLHGAFHPPRQIV